MRPHGRPAVALPHPRPILCPGGAGWAVAVCSNEGRARETEMGCPIGEKIGPRKENRRTMRCLRGKVIAEEKQNGTKMKGKLPSGNYKCYAPITSAKESGAPLSEVIVKTSPCGGAGGRRPRRDRKLWEALLQTDGSGFRLP